MKTLLTLFMAILIAPAFAQNSLWSIADTNKGFIIDVDATCFSGRPTMQYSAWRPAEETSFMVIDTKNNHLNINARFGNEYRLIQIWEDGRTEEGWEYLIFHAIDADGTACDVKLLIEPDEESEEEFLHVYVSYGYRSYGFIGKLPQQEINEIPVQ